MYGPQKPDGWKRPGTVDSEDEEHGPRKPHQDEDDSESDIGPQPNLLPQEVSKHLIGDVSRVESLNWNMERLWKKMTGFKD